MRTIAILNQKGGSGKTTTAVNLAAALGAKKRRCLVIDVDPQGSASHWYGVVTEEKGLFEVLVNDGNLADNIYKTDAENVDLIPSTPWLVGADKALASEVGVETILRQAIEKLPSAEWDYLFFDCPPNLGVLTINALTAAKEILIPVEAHVMALTGLAQLLKTIEMVQSRLNGDLKICGILPCRVDFRTRHCQEVVEQLKARFGEAVFLNGIRENVRIAECPSFHQPIHTYDRRSIGAKDYFRLADELIAQERRIENGQEKNNRKQPVGRRCSVA